MCTVGHERTPEKETVERGEEHEARNISRALPGRERERKESVEVEYDKTSIPLMETDPPLRATPYDAPADNL